jgi:transcriptional regulator of acetoin/glycerol metabolism
MEQWRSRTAAMHPTPTAPDRLLQIADARRAVMQENRSMPESQAMGLGARAWIERSWRRCLQAGHEPGQRVGFDLIPVQAMRRTAEANRTLATAARPVLEQLARAIASTRYFAVLTNHEGVVVDAQGAIDRADRRAQLITRVGVDLSERAVGTTAIGAALAELQPVWLHRGEHFFDDTGCYSCAGAPLFGPDGECVGMLDLTGIDAQERPELRHLAAQSARSIGNALALMRPHALLLRINWPGRPVGGEDDGLITLDGEGWVRGSNEAARDMIPQLHAHGAPVHCSELFGQPWEPFFDLAAQAAVQVPVEVSLWSGLRLVALPRRAGEGAGSDPVPLKEAQLAMIRRAVAEAKGNVTAAALSLGISRATVYRKLGRKH